MAKVITKRLHERLDNFIYQNDKNEEPMGVESMTDIPKNKKVIKNKADGLIEKVNISNPVFITEDNRQLLRD